MRGQLNKTSKKRSKKVFYFTIISSIIKNGALPKIGTKQKLNYYVKQLKTNGLIQKKGYATWELTELGKAYINKKEVKKTNLDALVQPNTFCYKRSKKNKEKIRGHGFMWRIKTPLVKNKSKLLKHLSKHNPTLTKTKTIKLFVFNHNVKIGSRSIIVNFNPDIYFEANSAKECFKAAVYELKRLIIRLENILGYSLRVKGKHQFKACKKHFGHLNNEIAKDLVKKKVCVSIKQNGKEWLVVDFSDKKFIELETTDNERNIVDSDLTITPFMNKLRSKPKVLDEMEAKIERMENLMLRQTNLIEALTNKINTSDNQNYITNFKY